MTDETLDGFRLDRDDVVIVFAHLQPAIVRNSGTISPKMIEAGALALAEAAAVLDIPMLFSLVPREGGDSSPLPALAPYVHDENSFVHRVASPFMDEDFVAALSKTGRRTLVLAGYSTEAIIVFASLDAIAAGYKVVVALDAGGARGTRIEEAALRRIERAGAVSSSVIGVVMGCAPEFGKSPDSEAFAAVQKLLGMRE
ncbi:isochorismatase family protein [Novosphingobium sp. 11B]